MPREVTARPLWQVTAIEAKRQALAKLPLAEQEAARLAQVAARERFNARKDARKALAHLIYSRLFDGATLEEIARGVERSVNNVRAICASWGLPVSQKIGCRRAPMFWVTNESYAALVSAAHDRGVKVAELLEEFIKFGAEDEARILRRTLHVRRPA